MSGCASGEVDKSIRLKKLIKELNLNQTVFAKSIGIAQPNINRMVSGENKISWEALNGIAEKYAQVNLDWLLTGNGEMFFGGEDSGVQESTPSKVRLEELEERVARLEELIKKQLQDQGHDYCSPRILVN